jgi:hypothetical protein
MNEHLKLKILILLILIFPTLTYGQIAETSSRNQIYFEGQIGLSHYLKNKIDDELNNAVNFGARFRFELAKRKLSIAPSFNLRQFTRKEGHSDSEEYLLTLIKSGIQLSFMVIESKDQNLQLHSLCEFNYTWSAYDYRYEVNSYNPTDSPNKDLFKILAGKGPGIMLGYRLKYHFVFVEMSYDIYGSKHYLSNEAKEAFDQQDIDYEESFDQGINTFNFNIGFSIPLIWN